jgi:hypothetical protein
MLLVKMYVLISETRCVIILKNILFSLKEIRKLLAVILSINGTFFNCFRKCVTVLTMLTNSRLVYILKKVVRQTIRIFNKHF